MHAIQINGLSFHYGQRPALDGVAFTVATGQICGLLGPNGSGKTTLFRILATLLRPSAGQARIFDLDVVAESAAVRRCIGVVFQSPSLDDRLTVRENLLHHGHLYGLRGESLRQRIALMLDAVGLADRAGDQVGTLSGGLKRRAELSKALLHEPRILLLDEPATGLDPAARRAFGKQLRELQRHTGVTTLLTTHIMDEADECDTLVLLDAGRVVDQGSPADLKKQISGDCVVIHARDPEALSRRMTERLGLRPRRVDQTLRVEQPDGPAIVRRLYETFGAEIESVSLARPTLEDVFIHRTGRRLEDEA
jgi:ABC-2 type transport system ATP-binding protein